MSLFERLSTPYVDGYEIKIENILTLVRLNSTLSDSRDLGRAGYDIPSIVNAICAQLLSQETKSSPTQIPKTP